MQPSEATPVVDEKPAELPKVGKALAHYHARGLFGPAARINWNGATGLYEVKIRLRGRSKAYRTLGTGANYREALISAIQKTQPKPEGVAQ